MSPPAYALTAALLVILGYDVAALYLEWSDPGTRWVTVSEFMRAVGGCRAWVRLLYVAVAAFLYWHFWRP